MYIILDGQLLLGRGHAKNRIYVWTKSFWQRVRFAKKNVSNLQWDDNIHWFHFSSPCRKLDSSLLERTHNMTWWLMSSFLTNIYTYTLYLSTYRFLDNINFHYIPLSIIPDTSILYCTLYRCTKSRCVCISCLNCLCLPCAFRSTIVSKLVVTRLGAQLLSNFGRKLLCRSGNFMGSARMHPF